MSYFKATRTDATDFRTGTVLYEVGKRVRPLKHNGRRSICGPGYLHASDVPTETLVGGGWPCRLFKVEGKPSTGFNNEHPHKGGFKQLTVVKELPAHKVFGPQGKELVEHFERIKNCTPEEIEELAKAWDSARDSAWASARDSARDSAWDSARDSAWDSARDSAWASARDSARDSAWVSARDSALAILTRDLIGTGNYTQEQHDLLYEPWRKVIVEKDAARGLEG